MRRILVLFLLAACGGGGSSGDDAGNGGGDPLDPSLAPPIDTNPDHYPANVWVTDGMQKVQPDATPGDVKWAIVWAAKNETESFQVHVQGPIALTVSASELTGPGGATIPAPSIFREAYLDITTLSDANGTLGLTPDPLIPTVDSTVHEPRNAFPVDVPAGETRSAWIDIAVPDDAPSGYYTGTITVLDGGNPLTMIPIELAVWDYQMPSTATLKSAFSLGWESMCLQAYGSYAACGAYPGANGDADTGVELTHVAAATMWLDERVSLAGAVYYYDPNNPAHFDQVYGPLMDGTADTRLAGAKLTHLWYSGDVADAAQLASWSAHFDQKGWLDRTSAYYCDEPPSNNCSFDEVRAKADGIAAAAPALARLLTTDLGEATTETLLDRIEIMVAIVESMENRDMPSMRDQYDSWLGDPTHHLWWYQSCDEHESCSDGSPGPATSTWPSYMVDATPVRNRVFQWLAYVYGIEGELYYASDYCWESSCGGQSDPWVSIYAFGGNGDGTLFYPGTPAKIGGTTPVPVPSIRLELIRDGMEDYELLHALDAAGQGDAARAAAATFIANNYTFDNDPTALQAARKTLGDALHHLAHP